MQISQRSRDVWVGFAALALFCAGLARADEDGPLMKRATETFSACAHDKQDAVASVLANKGMPNFRADIEKAHVLFKEVCESKTASSDASEACPVMQGVMNDCVKTIEKMGDATMKPPQTAIDRLRFCKMEMTGNLPAMKSKAEGDKVVTCNQSMPAYSLSGCFWNTEAYDCLNALEEKRNRDEQEQSTDAAYKQLGDKSLDPADITPDRATAPAKDE
jgi:hypothetical protein